MSVVEVVSGKLRAGDPVVTVGAENMTHGAMIIVVRGLGKPAPAPKKGEAVDETH